MAVWLTKRMTMVGYQWATMRMANIWSSQWQMVNVMCYVRCAMCYVYKCLVAKKRYLNRKSIYIFLDIRRRPRRSTTTLNHIDSEQLVFFYSGIPCSCKCHAPFKFCLFIDYLVRVICANVNYLKINFLFTQFQQI